MSLPYKKTLSAPCKLNLTLDVGPPRPDGYHSIDSVVALLSPSDELTVQVRPGPRTVKLILKDRRPDAVAEPALPKGQENLAYSAAQAAIDALAPDQDIQVWITLAKRLPAQAGLGAGSSDAATVLQAVAEALEAPAAALPPIAATLGSDVSLFLSGNACRMQGRGEQVTPLATPLPTFWGVLARPAIGVPTGPAYAALDAIPNRTPGTATEPLLQALQAGADALAIAPLLSNDFEAAVLPEFPEVAAAHHAVQEAGALRALLCGSGSSVFGLARDRVHALELVKALAGKLAWVKLASTLA
ncbi:MAG: 4-(cytidine 5'-diphospho)-2-C-methyl-D-erythritol kinase [Armatimonas sp.]